VLVSVAGSAGFIVAQPALLAGRDPAAVTAVQLATGALAVLPAALIAEGVPPLPAGMTADGASSLAAVFSAPGAPVAAWAGLALAGTALPFWLFAFGQARVQAEVAGAFVNLEPLVGAAAGWIAYHEAVTAAQLGGGAALLAGIALSTLAGGEGGRTRRVDGPPSAAGDPTRRRWPAPAHRHTDAGRVTAMTILSTATQTRRLPVGHAYCVPVVRETPRPQSVAGDSAW
jgi:O-acetylserine/cysteine efflux transporter